MRTLGPARAALPRLWHCGLALALIVSCGTGCAGRAAPSQLPGQNGSAMPAAVTDDTFGVRLHAVLRGGANPEKETASLRLGVVKQALTHASVRFGHGSDERAMMSVF